ncbi:hypothetical protein A3I48_00195 [Candidatus Daviesbacteria bacterium RIFCSPLOWO2_02_FULL_36_7]|uniref:Uncharacterized protein n=1 Tax=Candidatus Daviesbacteria bacterium RIFCSPLOWO2_02_FULL_36_7 TaxID=1797792 RepID=A0A1F5MGT5_9BACT|nr:MAG: hypothetical protein A3I48_00195 [Candidatus Daviesbacteria bacterium RIFCSPLOWO2_02_FULL_36_7]
MLAELLDTRSPLIVREGYDSLKKESVLILPQVGELDRQYGLMYLATTRRYLTRPEVDSLGDVLYEDAKSKRIRSLREVAQEAGVIPKDSGRRKLRSLSDVVGVAKDWWYGRDDSCADDAFLNHAVPSYKPEEMERTFEEVFLSGERNTGMIDLVAGFDHSRPLLWELELMCGLVGMMDKREGGNSDGSADIFVPTFGGREFSKAISICYEAYKWPQGLVLALGSYGSREVHYNGNY